jgi:cytochrome b6
MSESAPAPEGSGFFGWLDKRYGLTPLVEFLKHKEVPIGSHSMFWYYLGGTTLFFFMVQLLTGVLLLMYYQAGEQTSYESIRLITTKVPFGWLVRSMHCWSAHLMIISLVTHMFSTMMLKAYRPPREMTWVTGFVLLTLALGFGFSGYLLPWNELAFFATAVGTDSVKSVPVIGDWLLQVLRGGPDVTINTLHRFFGFHVVVLPLATGAVVGAHLMMIQRQGMAPPVGEQKAPRGMKFFPDFAMRDLLLWLICLIVLAVLCVFLPYGPHIPGVEWELGKKANPLAPAYPGIKPEWYFLWVYQLLKEFPPHFLGLRALQAALPWLDKGARQGKPSDGFTDAGVAALFFLVFLTFKAWDIGGGPPTGKEPDAVAVARVCSFWALGLIAISTALRAAALHHRWFLFTAANALQIALHGVFGMSYLSAAGVGLIATAIALFLARPRPGAGASATGVHP